MWPCGRLAKLAVCGGILKCVAGLARSRGTRAPGAILTREALSLSSGHARSRGSVVAAPNTEEEVEDPLAPPEEWASPKPGRRPDIFPEFEKLKVRVFSGSAALTSAPALGERASGCAPRAECPRAHGWLALGSYAFGLPAIDL